MRIRRSPSPTRFLSRAYQFRLLSLVGLLALVLIATRVAAKPGTWNWLFMGQKNQPSSSEPSKTKRTKKLLPGEFRSPLKTGSGKTGPGNEKRPNGDLDLDPRLFANVRDKEFLRQPELEAYYGILSRVAKIPSAELQRRAKSNVARTVLMGDPEHFRGAILSIHGKLGPLHKLPNHRKDLGLPSLYEAWIAPDDSGKEPYRVVFGKLPAGLEPRDGFDPPTRVRATGYFFKIQRFRVNKERKHNAPLILADRIELVTEQPGPSRGLGFAPYIVGVALVLSGILAFTFWRLNRGDKEISESQLKRFDEARSGNPQDLNELQPGEDAEEFFRNLS